MSAPQGEITDPDKIGKMLKYKDEKITISDSTQYVIYKYISFLSKVVE